MAGTAISIPRNGTGMKHYEAACRALALAKSVDEAKEILDKAEAIRAYARQMKNKKLELDAVEIRARAERRWAELHEPMKAKGTRGQLKGQDSSGGKKKQPPEKDVPTLKELGVSKELSARAHKLAEIPDKVFEEKLATWREIAEKENDRVTPNILKIGDKKQKHIRGTFGTGKNEWCTPIEYIELARRVMGKIDLDPATSEHGQNIIKAEEFFTPLENGLNHPWHGRIWLNPPHSQPDIADFVAKLVSEFRAGHLTAAILLTHNYTDTAWFHDANSACSAMCFTRGRVKFQDEKGNVAAPTQGQIFFYFGRDIEAFATHFQEVGSIDVPFRGGSGLWQLKGPSKKALRASSADGMTLTAKAKHTLEGQTAERTP
jgi:phage N-6-adenine-methyltransferase